MTIKLNLGCGTHHQPIENGWVNIDKYDPADAIADLEQEWPWVDNTIDEVLFQHSLEHMGATVDGFKHILQQLYRVCKADAKVTIVVPHPRHDDFINDPTHVRIITPEIMNLFSKKKNEQWAKEETPNTPLALQWGVDFEMVSCQAYVDPRLQSVGEDMIKRTVIGENNVIKQYEIICRVVK